MPWKETNAVEQREKFIQAVLARSMPFRDVCETYGISRTTGYTWLERYHGNRCTDRCVGG